MIKVKLIAVDSTRVPNLALMKISAYHKFEGDKVGFDIGDPDLVYISTIYSWNRPLALGIAKMFNCDVKIGGYGSNNSMLPAEIEFTMPDYSLYGIDYSIGFTSRGCVRKCPFCDVWKKEGKIKAWSTIEEFLHPDHNKILLLDNNLLASPTVNETLYTLMSLSITEKLKVCFNQGLDIRLIDDNNAKYLADIDFRSLNFRARRLYFAWDDFKLCTEEEVKRGIQTLQKFGIKSRQLMFYMLTGYNTSFEEDVYRFQKLCGFDVDPFVMLYDKKGDSVKKEFARWVNQRFYKFIDFERFCKYRKPKKKVVADAIKGNE